MPSLSDDAKVVATVTIIGAGLAAFAVWLGMRFRDDDEE